MIDRNKIGLTTAGRRDQFPRDGVPQVAFSGRSNVGKSSLLNRLCKRKSLARVSAEPGKTVTVNFYRVDGKVDLVDLPGYGYARRSEAEKRRWSALTDAYFQNNASLSTVLQLIDLKTGPSADDRMMLDWLKSTGTPFVIAATKLDKLNKTQQKENLAALQKEVGESVPVFPLSSRTGEGVELLWSLIEKTVEAAE